MLLRRKELLTLLVLGAIAALGLPGCDGGDGSGGGNATARYFNALIGVNGNSVDILSPRSAGFVTRAANLPFGTTAPAVGSLLLPVESGSETFQVFATGTTTPVLATIPTTLASNTGYLIATSGIVGRTDAAVPRIMILTDAVPGVGSNQAAVRVVHLSPGAPNLDIFQTPAGGQPAPITGLTNLAYGTASPYAIVTAGNYNLSVREAGTTNVISTATNTSTVGLVGGKAYTLFIIGLVTPVAGQPAFDVRIVADN
jgi:hypothetical protein